MRPKMGTSASTDKGGVTDTGRTTATTTTLARKGTAWRHAVHWSLRNDSALAMDDVLCITSSTFKVSATVFLRAPRMINRYTITTVARIPFYRATVSVTDFCRGIAHHHYHSSRFDFSCRSIYLQRIPQSNSNPTIMAFILEPGTCRSRHRTSTSGLLIWTDGPSTGTEWHSQHGIYSE